MNKYPLSIKIAYLLLSVILFIYALIAAKDFLYPIVLGLLFGYLLYPMACFFEKHGIPRILANILSILIFLIIVASALLFIYKQAGSFIDDFPLYKHRALNNIDRLEGELVKQFGLSELRLVDLIRFRVKSLFEAGSDVLNNAFQNTAGTLFRLAVLPVYIFMFLFYRTKLALFILKIVPREKKIIAIHVLKDYSHVVSRYMGGMSSVVFILAILNSTGLLIVGIEHAIVFGIISALFNFVPYFGTLMGGSIPFLFALLTGESPLLALHVLILFIIIQFIENNILTPNIVGSNLRLNAMVIIIGIIAGGMVWGIPGMFAIVPILAMLNILAENVVALHPYAFLLGTSGARKHAITLNNLRKFLKKIRNRSKVL